jgi:glyoxylase-like metal-dependent hydrolase (beta-lactamase superfamily II)
VYWLSIRGSNVYFVRSGLSWVLVDTAWANCGRALQQAAQALFGANARPAAILLTHDHPDHAGSALELARGWGCPVYLHPDELPLAVAGDLATLVRYANPLDRWIILPVLRAMGPRRVASMLAQASLAGVARAFDPGVAVPGLPDWTCIPTPGHSPGHVAFFRGRDRVLITGDALLTVDLNSFWGWLSWGLRASTPRVAGSPWYTNWDQRAVEASVAALTGLEPSVLATGHGVPMAGDAVARELRAYAARVAALAAAKRPEAERAVARQRR